MRAMAGIKLSLKYMSWQRMMNMNALQLRPGEGRHYTGKVGKYEVLLIIL